MGKSSTVSNGGKENFLLKAFIAGNSCAVVAAILNPFDVAKIRLQNQSSSLRYTGMINAIVTIGKEEGLRGLSAGVTASMIREILYSSVRIGGYEPIRKALSTPDSNPADASPIIKLFSALISGGVGAAIVNPFDLIKTRFQSILPGEVSPYRHTFHALAAIYRRDKVSGLYRGWTVTSSRAAVLTSSQLGSYDSIKHNLLMNICGMEDGITLHLVASMCAGLITTTATIPLDVVKTRYLSDYGGKYSGVADCVTSTFKIDGVRGFFKGWLPAYMRLGPHTVISFMLIEEIRTFLGLNTI